MSKAIAAKAICRAATVNRRPTLMERLHRLTTITTHTKNKAAGKSATGQLESKTSAASRQTASG